METQLTDANKQV
uniref:Uncharacterized protein n=1 Tax=Timema tahoe TaxID=61484 RepID=A0A7R9P226_9NEOP|nr:unnamed protein product [Timema tahoe]